MHRLFITAAFLAMAGLAHSAESPTPLAPGFTLEKHSVGELSASWWMWAMSSPDEINPVRDISGNNCHVGQQGNIWFLAGGFGSSKIKRNCVVPAGKSIFFPVVNMVYYPREENNGFTCEQAKANAAVNNDKAIDLFVELDGVSVKNPKRYRARTEKCFNIFERVPKKYQPINAYPSASDGYWIGLSPLNKGKHTLKFGGRYNSESSAFGRMVQDIEYEITVE
ncbi:hypothetical protein [Methylomonas sp. TEB]|uniref:hypothetical protein n=1 Tax=Methylomonas sp. TEB TaxID=3398229 RepID=UPI0039F6280D